MPRDSYRVDNPYHREGPVVMVLGDDDMDIDSAQPHPIMAQSRAVWKRTKGFVKLGIFAAFAGAYPSWMAASHSVDVTPVPIDGANWASPEAGVAMTLIAREVSGPGWSADKASWNPVHHLTAQPAWQVSLTYSLSDVTQLSAALAISGNEPDTDLAAASRLLRPTAGEPMTPRLIAAAEALASYDSRVASGTAADIDTAEQVTELLGLFVGWAEDSAGELSDQIALGAAWPASRADIRAFYNARARAHVASHMIDAAVAKDPDIAKTAAIRAQIREATTAWYRVAQQAPLIVSNQNGDNPLLPNHLAAMAWHLNGAEDATRQLADMVAGTHEGDISIANAGNLVLAPTSAP
ncbi:MAG: hypothetical protein AAFR00_06785 [Pseudomonadota bacterium]